MTHSNDSKTHKITPITPNSISKRNIFQFILAKLIEM